MGEVTDPLTQTRTYLDVCPVNEDGQVEAIRRRDGQVLLIMQPYSTIGVSTNGWNTCNEEEQGEVQMAYLFCAGSYGATQLSGLIADGSIVRYKS